MTVFMYAFCAIVWGVNFVVIKIQGTPLNLELSLTYRLGGTVLLFVAFLYLIKPRGRLSRQDFLPIASFGICNLALSYICLYYATIWVSAALVTLIFSLKTVMTPIALRICLGDRLHPRILVGGSMGIMGVSILVYPLLMNGAGVSNLKGIAIALLGTLLTAIGDVASARNVRCGVNAMYSNSIGFAVAFIFSLMVCLIQKQSFTLPISFSYLGALMFLIVFSSFTAWMFYLKLVARIGASASSYMVALFPAIGGISSVIIGDSAPTFYLLFGCLFSGVGALIALR